MKKKDNNKNVDGNKPFFLKKYSKPIVELKEDEEEESVREVVVERDNGFRTVEVIVIILISICFGIVVGCVLSSSRTLGVEVSEEVQEIITTYESIVENYYGEIDEKELLDSAVSGMISTLDDPYSVFMDSTDTEEFNETVDGSFVGIGISVEWSEGIFRIIDVLDNSPAEKSKLQVEDCIIKIGDVSTEEMDLDELSSRIRGKEGTSLSLTVKRGEEEVTVNVKRGIVEIPTVSSKVIDGSVGYISIESFASNTAEQFTEELEELEEQGIKSLIIDVRDNPGGRLGQTNDILDLFFDKKTVLYQLETKDDTVKIYAKKKDKKDYPVAVLVNFASASASEILAASFQDNYKKSVIVGTVTYGKGTIQKAVELSSGASIKYTTQKWLTSKGEWINDKGVIPDAVVDQGEEYSYNPTIENDLQLQRALEELKKKES